MVPDPKCEHADQLSFMQVWSAWNSWYLITAFETAFQHQFIKQVMWLEKKGCNADYLLIIIIIIIF